MAMEWREKQLQAIEFKGRNAIVSAAAGSGKTAVLVERVIRLISDEESPVPADSLVIATFTRKAAEEMRVRLSQSLEKKLAQEKDNDYLRSQLIALEDAHISTISSFCLDLLKENAGLAEIAPGFSVMDESEAALLREKAMKQTLESIYADRENNGEIISWYCGTRDNALSESIYQLFDATRNIPDGKGWLTEQEKYYNGGFTDFVQSEDERAAGLIRLALEHISKIDVKELTEAAAAAIGAVKAYTERWNGIKGYSKKENSGAVYALISEGIPTKKPLKDPAVKAERDLAYDYLKKALDIIQLTASADNDAELCGRVLHGLIKAEQLFEQILASLKRDRNAVDFSDIELMTYGLLTDGKGGKSPLAEELSERFSYIIVDEFQDSNRLQYEIFRLISKGNNLYFVGDIKQSIYKFRGADPLVFARLLKNPDFEALLLNENFRSNGCVVKAVNGVFEGLMTESLGDTDYDEGARLVKGNTAIYNEETETEENRAELAVIESAMGSDTEAVYVAERISQMLKTGFLVTEKDGSRRKCTYKDFAILMRSGVATTGKAFSEELKNRGIPVKTKKESGFTDRREIMLMVDLLTVIDNPYKNIAMADVLLSPLYNFSDGKLAMLRRMKNENGHAYKYLYDAVTALKDTDSQCGRFCRDLSQLRTYMANNSVESLVRHILDDTELIPLMSASEKGNIKAANLRLHLQYVKLFSRSDGSLSDYISYINDMRKNNVALTEADSADGEENAVSILTVHASKGLEYPIVFMVKNQNRINFSDSYGVLLADNNDGIGMTVIDRDRMVTTDTLFHAHIAGCRKNAERSQSLRLLYVAMTRAREKLIMTAALKPPSKEDGEHFVPPEDCWLKWLMESGSVKNGAIRLTKLTDEDIEASTDIAQEEETAADYTELSEKIKENLSRSYAFEEITKIPAKVTVSEVGIEDIAPKTESGKDKGGVKLFIRKPSFIEKSDEMTGKERGDAYHKVLELISWDKAAENAENQLKAFLDCGKITQSEFDCVKAADIQKLMDSPLGERIRNSGMVRREQPLFTEIEPKAVGFDVESEDKPFVQGIADMFFAEEDGIVLVDYKTNVNVTEEDLYSEYFGQLDIYAKAISEMTGMRVKERLIWSVYLGKAVDMMPK